mmetsp:Transcript_56491/g.175162  ORF Transcript_56491/g.175162 Transcript_56491/m.175162 type:complete len:204 (-) Transcript_56491:109-720(-)
MPGVEELPERAEASSAASRPTASRRSQSQPPPPGPEEAPGREPMRRGMLGSAPTTENIVIWAAAQLLHREEHLLVEPGRFYHSGVPRRVDQRLHDMLQPVFQHIHRDDHTERRAFLSISRAIVNRCGYEGIPDVSGRIAMYIAHFPCISCVAVICQFIRFFPCVRLDMDFDNMWKTRWKYGFRCRATDHSYRGVRSLAQKSLA